MSIIVYVYRENLSVKTEENNSTAKEFTISMYDDDYAYFTDYVQYGSFLLILRKFYQSRNIFLFTNDIFILIGVNVVPEAAMLVHVWEELADLKNMNYKDMSIRFQDIKIHEQIILQPEDIVRLEILIHEKGCKKFQVIFE